MARLVRTIPTTILMILGLVSFARATSESGPREDGFSLSGVDRLVVEGSFFSVTVAGHPQENVQASMSIPERQKERGVKVLHEQSGSELRVWVEKPALSIGSVRGGTALIELRVPRNTDLRVGNSSGAVDVSGLTSSQVDVETSSGKISVAESDGDISANSSSGSQNYTSVQGSIAAESSSGKMMISGSVGTLDLKSSSGGLGGTDVTITGASSFRTGSGAINFDFANNMDDFSFDLESSSGTISAGSTRAKGTVHMGGGPIPITGRSSSGRQTYE